MEYTIGCRVLNKDGKVADGFYVFGEYGLPYITNEPANENKKNRIYVIDGAKDTQLYIQYLSRLYRYEFRSRAKKLNAPVKEFRFYPIKMTDTRLTGCQFEKDKNFRVNKNRDKEQFLGNPSNVSLCYIKK